MTGRTTTTYDDVLDELGRRSATATTATTDAELRALLKRCESCLVAASSDDDDDDDAPSVVHPFRPGGLADRLVERLLLLADDDDDRRETAAAALTVAKALVRCLPDPYLPVIARSVSDLVMSAAAAKTSTIKTSAGDDDDAPPRRPRTTLLRASPEVLRLWVSLVANPAVPVGVHDVLAEALPAYANLRKKDDDGAAVAVATTAMEALVEGWRSCDAAEKESKSGGGGCGSVRCAVAMVRWTARLPGGIAAAKAAGGTDLFEAHLGDFDDPLRQLSLLDALVEEFGGGGTGTATPTPEAGEWLASPSVTSPVVRRMLRDPLLSDAALRYLGTVAVRIRPGDLGSVLDHVRWTVTEKSNGVVPTRDADRLPLVSALSGAASNDDGGFALERILDDEVLRRAWWDTGRIALPKLKAAILVSVASAFDAIGTVSCWKAYRLLGADNNHNQSGGNTMTTTTTWLLGSARSPVPEVAIAAAAVLEAALRLPGSDAALTASDRRGIVDLCLEDPRESSLGSTPDGRLARHAVLEALLDHQGGSDLPERSALERRRGLGPHGRIPLRFDGDPATAA